MEHDEVARAEQSTTISTHIAERTDVTMFPDFYDFQPFHPAQISIDSIVFPSLASLPQSLDLLPIMSSASSQSSLQSTAVSRVRSLTKRTLSKVSSLRGSIYSLDEPLGEDDDLTQICSGSIVIWFHIPKQPSLDDPYALEVALLPHSKTYLEGLPGKKRLSRAGRSDTLFGVNAYTWGGLIKAAAEQWDMEREKWDLPAEARVELLKAIDSKRPIDPNQVDGQRGPTCHHVFNYDVDPDD
ncbi:hypothetical protein HD553DRAFT_312362, partial [Filobasidium floriforme]|uniref:uncharacterized protein n=1 Tax=Filobasidium floriforme TaxID=5210 RepID=UPI001E8E8551